MDTCLFCKIVKKELSPEVAYEDNQFLAFKDIHPIAPIHLLIIPKKHIPSVDHLELYDKELVGELFVAARSIAKSQGISQTGYRLIFNVGADAGQSVNHLHLHILGGKKLSWL